MKGVLVMDVNVICGALTIEKSLLDYTIEKLSKNLSNFEIVTQRDSSREDILATNPQVPPLLAEYGEANGMYVTFVFKFEVDSDSLEYLADSVVDPILAVFSDGLIF